MNNREKGQRNERRGCLDLMRKGCRVFRLYQPRGTAQGEFDAIAIDGRYIRFVQFRTNQWKDLRPLKAFNQFYCQRHLIPTVEVWMYKDREKEPRQRVIE